MKALLPVVILLALSSCKDKTYCFACQTVTTVVTENDGNVSTSMSKASVDTCGLTESEVRMYERATTDSTVSSVGVGKVTTKRATGCI